MCKYVTFPLLWLSISKARIIMMGKWVFVFTVALSSMSCRHEKYPSKQLGADSGSAKIQCAQYKIASLNHEIYGIGLVNNAVLLATTAGAYKLTDKIYPLFVKSGLRLNSAFSTLKKSAMCGFDVNQKKMMVLLCGENECSDIEINGEGYLSAVWLGANDKIIVAGKYNTGKSIILERLEGEWVAMNGPEQIDVRAFNGESIEELRLIATDWSNDWPQSVVYKLKDNNWELEKSWPELRGTSLKTIDGILYSTHGYPDTKSGINGIVATYSGNVWSDIFAEKGEIFWAATKRNGKLILSSTILGSVTKHVINEIDDAGSKKIFCENGEPFEAFLEHPNGNVLAAGREGGVYRF